MLSFFQRLLYKKLIFIDQFENQYYRYDKDRWVKYSHSSRDPSSIPPLCYLWLHKAINDHELNYKPYIWEKIKQPNLTGTDGAYLPSRHILKNPSITQQLDYIPWHLGDE